MNLADAPQCLLNSTWGGWSSNKYPCGDDHAYLWDFMKNNHLQKITKDLLPSPKFYHWFMTGTSLKITLFDKVTRAEGKYTQIILFLTLISICLGKDFSSFEQSVSALGLRGFDLLLMSSPLLFPQANGALPPLARKQFKKMIQFTFVRPCIYIMQTFGSTIIAARNNTKFSRIKSEETEGQKWGKSLVRGRQNAWHSLKAISKIGWSTPELWFWRSWCVNKGGV